MAKTKVQCMDCAYEFTLKSWGYDKLEEDYSFYTVCPKCKSSFNIADESAEAILISNGTKVKLFNNTIGIIPSTTIFFCPPNALGPPTVGSVKAALLPGTSFMVPPDKLKELIEE